jgi:hypothetical protein
MMPMPVNGFDTEASENDERSVSGTVPSASANP